MTDQPAPARTAVAADRHALDAELEAALKAPLVAVHVDGSKVRDVHAPAAAERVSDRPGIRAWQERALAGVKRMHEDEAYRLSLNARLS